LNKTLVFIFLSVCSVTSFADLRVITTPEIQGDTLYIEGPIDSHIYNYFAYEYKALEGVNKVSLNSYGGNHYWALLTAEKIKDYGFTTIVEDGNFCASACVYLFGVGSERLLGDNAWLGVHGARISGGHVITFRNLCPQENFEQGLAQSQECEEFLNNMFITAMDATSEAFDLIESAGVSPEFREYYFSLNNDPNWYRFNNILLKPDLVVNADSALEFQLSTGSLRNRSLPIL